MPLNDLDRRLTRVEQAADSTRAARRRALQAQARALMTDALVDAGWPADEVESHLAQSRDPLSTLFQWTSTGILAGDAPPWRRRPPDPTLAWRPTSDPYPPHWRYLPPPGWFAFHGEDKAAYLAKYGYGPHTVWHRGWRVIADLMAEQDDPPDPAEEARKARIERVFGAHCRAVALLYGTPKRPAWAEPSERI